MNTVQSFRTPGNVTWTAASIVAVGCAHVAIGYALYYCRSHQIAEVFHSDVLVFFLPAMLAIGANLYLVMRALNGLTNWQRIAISMAIAILAVIVSFTVFLFVAFNSLGT